MTLTQLSSSKPRKPKENAKLHDSAHQSQLQHHDQTEESDDDDEHEPSLFDILDNDAEDDPEEDVPEDQQA